MSKYIDAELFVAYMSGVKQKSKLLGYILAADEDEIIRLIKKQPAADVAEVVRCRECRYREKEQPGMVYCPNTVGGWVDEDWFCADGAKMDEVKK